MSKITPNLWFNDEAEAAANFYISAFPNSKITMVSHYPDEGQEVTGQKAGTVLVVAFELDGQPFMALNGGDAGFKFNESISFVVDCETQKDIDYYWDKLTADGGEPGVCGWLKDKYGVSWQITPPMLDKAFADNEPEKAARVMKVMLQMKKIDIAALEAATKG